MSSSTIERGRLLAERLGLPIVRQDGRDLRIACVHNCGSQDNGHIDIDSGVYSCWTCSKGLSAFDLCKVVLGDPEAAKRLMIEVGLFQDLGPGSNGNGKASRNGHTAPVSAGDEAGYFAVCAEKRMPPDAVKRYGGEPYRGGLRIPMWGPDLKVCSHIHITPANGRYPKGKNDFAKPAGLFLPSRSPEPGESWIIVEGPKDAAALHKLGHLVAGLPGNRMKADFAPLFKDVDVLVMADGDKPGREGAAVTAKLLRGVARSVKVGTFPDGMDARDVLAQDGPEGIGRAILNASGGREALEPPRFITALMSSAQLDDLPAEPRYIVKNMVPAGQVGAEGVKSKGCKTGIATDLAISGASGTRCLNEFDVPEPVPVLFLCGESGPSKIRRQARQICEARGLSLRDLPIFWGFDLPKLCLPLDVEALAEFIQQKKIVLAIIDPLYLSLFTAETAGRSGDLYTMGATFEPLTAVCRETGASILLVHHFRKNRNDDQQEPCSLEELSQAGLAEVARWWILLDRREPYAGDGRHALWLRVGGSEGHASFWSLDIDEGLICDSEGNQRTTKWETTLGRVQDAKGEEKRQRENRKALDLEKRDGEHVEKLALALRKYPAGQTARQLRADSRLNGDNFLRAVAVLQQAGRIEEISIAKQRGSYDGFKLKT
jgi:hypothetical protein